MTTDTAKPLRRDAAENRERLLTAAGQVFADHGLDAGVEEVARVAGVGMGTLYRRFPSKQALIDELVGGMRQGLLDVAHAADASPDGTGLETLLLGAGELLAAHPGCLRQLWAHSDAGIEAIEEFRRLIATLLSAAQQHGRVRADITPSDISVALWSVSGIIEITGTAAPTAWRRHLQLLIAGLRPVAREDFEPALTEAPVTPPQMLKVSIPH
jgi:AcrR family transcriptional regulator